MSRTNPNWGSTSTAFGSSLCTVAGCGAGARTGNGYVLFDGSANGSPSETATVTQSVNIPSGSVATLSYFLRPVSVSAPSSTTLTVSVDGVVVQTINEPGSASADYAQLSTDLTAFAGGNRTITFTYNRPAGASSDEFLLDDVALATSCGTPPVTVSGRVFSSTGLALRNVVVSLIDAQNIRRTSTTSSFGLYSFDNVRTSETYIISVSSKRFRFAPQILQFNSSVSNLDLFGLE